jgi:chitinase
LAYFYSALSFLLASGPADQAQQWTTLSASDRASALKSYHDAGVKVIVSAFGSTETPTTSGTDPASAAKTMAAWVKKYDLDGIDVDYEDMQAFDDQPTNAIAWLKTFTQTLRDNLPAGQYSISHAREWYFWRVRSIDKSADLCCRSRRTLVLEGCVQGWLPRS